MCLAQLLGSIPDLIVLLANLDVSQYRLPLALAATVIAIVLVYKSNLPKMLKIRSKSKENTKLDANLATIGHTVDYENQATVDASTMERLPRNYCDAGPHFKLMSYLHEDATTILESMERGARLNGKGNCLGRVDLISKSVIWLPYETVMERVKNFGNGVHHILGGGDFKVRKEVPSVGIYASNRPEYVIAEYGIYWHSLVAVPIYDTLGPNACSFISNQTEIECIVCDKLERVQIILSQTNVLKTVKYLVVFEDIPQSYKAKASSSGIKVFTIDEVEQIGKTNVFEPNKPKSENLALICYTSGTTDTPKGVMLTHGNVIANVSSVMYQMMEHTIRMDDILMSYLPLAHMFERCCENALFMVGGSVAYFSGDVKVLSNDMKIAMPTLLPAVPRLLTRIYCKIQDSVKGNVVKGMLLNTAYHFKQKQFEKTGVVRSDTFWDRLVFRKVRENLGGRVRLIMCGSAPLNSGVFEFLRCAFGCVVQEGYGQTECVAPCTMTLPADTKAGHVGPPLASATIKLADVPEMGYFAKEGKGEILVKGPIVFQGYFKDPERTRQALDADGWLHTGDIGAFTEAETLKIIDRKKNIFKLSQGEYIAPEKIENVYSQCTLVAQIFVYGESLKSTLVAVLVPDQVVLEMWCRNNNVNGDFKAMCRHKDVKKVILKELHLLGQRDGLKSFEQVKDIYVHDEMFSIENGMLTPTMKSKREEIYKQFKKQIDQLYSYLD